MPITFSRTARLRALQSLKWPSTKEIMQDCNEIEIVLIGNDDHTLFRGRFGFEITGDGKMSLARKAR